jgi:N-formylglutamate amidohydrolase
LPGISELQAVAVKLAARLAAFLILQTYSRLVIDCNRPPGSAESIVRLSETRRIPGNASVSDVDALAREREVFRRYHERIRTELDVRKAQHRHTILIAMHSFTPWFHGHRKVTGTWGRAIQQVSPHAGAVTIDRVFAAPNLKAVHMLIVPTESDLQYLVELGHRTIAPHQKPSPNQRADAAQYHPQLINLSFMTISRHTRSLHWCTAHPQLPVTLRLGAKSWLLSARWLTSLLTERRPRTS